MAGQGVVNNPVMTGPYPLRARIVKNTRLRLDAEDLFCPDPAAARQTRRAGPRFFSNPRRRQAGGRRIGYSDS
jgi:hypothetical protein